ncbi:MAG: hypothetical protein IPL65_02015 [Lewinellaceae bacterium]|nr:hypothetical protein [Lewinellaceae bacterium]
MYEKYKSYLSVRNAARLVLLLFALFHISSVVIHATISAYSSYTSFYEKPKDNKIIQKMGRLSQTKLYKYYGTVSATQSGYGFFAPNVRASSQLVIEGCGKEITPTFNSHEGRMRYEGFLGDLINNIEPDSLKKDKTKIEDVLDRYEKLLLKNISLKAIKDNNMSCAFYMVRYNVLDFPSRAEVLENGKTELRILPAKAFLIAKTN